MAKMESVWKKSSDAGNYDQARPDYPRQVVDVSINYLRQKYVGPLSLALDIGCGTGKSTEHLISPFETVVGCDPSLAMLEEARKNYGSHGKYVNECWIFCTLFYVFSNYIVYPPYIVCV